MITLMEEKDSKKEEENRRFIAFISGHECIVTQYSRRHSSEQLLNVFLQLGQVEVRQKNNLV
jgi:hypothetical protein